jgi:hypothetical protein
MINNHNTDTSDIHLTDTDIDLTDITVRTSVWRAVGRSDKSKWLEPHSSNQLEEGKTWRTSES